MPDGTLEATPQGVPQGGPLSPVLANIVLDPLDKVLERRAHRFARYADDFIVMVRSPRAAERVKASLTRFAEEKLKLVVNRTKSKAAPLQSCAFLGFQIGKRGKVAWTHKVQARFKQRVKDITRRNRGDRVETVIGELRRYVTGWINYFGISHSYTVVDELADCRSGGRAVSAPRLSKTGALRRALDPAKSAIVLLEAVETAADTASSPDQTRGKPRRGPYGDTQSQRLLAHEC
jgi:hypothetical protein